jgi:hypothetical protein
MLIEKLKQKVVKYKGKIALKDSQIKDLEKTENELNTKVQVVKEKLN